MLPDRVVAEGRSAGADAGARAVRPGLSIPGARILGPAIPGSPLLGLTIPGPAVT
ncbi:hypothetical protein SLNWT_5225 [Streptomyces albus]|uniref:Uncharacterized protein n=1 Tax=Streptomyces albus (strain ATCC 21838 / DSM 41398 / FERM P-419 / JCM 4703 / NBRC 107858) TaxID=1081613 RepID=A0A0B5F3W0_STRA4|nr:hypothetical protein SLNWT_5225 [Streptomyces albus]AOU79903.1 hypothetical protein SLNHY_5212 [Streptomyces albus]